MILYVPRTVPQRDVERLEDPFAFLTVAGGIFPGGPHDEYMSIARAAFSEHGAKIEEIFASGDPDFETLNQLETGASWP